MSNNFLVNKIRSKIKSLPANQKSIIILKGLPLALVEENFPADLDAALANPYRYFGGIVEGGRRFAAYEEYLLFRRAFCGEYDAVYILNNNLFVNQFPVEENFSMKTRKQLRRYYREEAEIAELPPEENIGQLAEIYSSFRKYSGTLICAYNDAELPESPKVTTLNLFDAADVDLNEIDAESAADIVDIQNEIDFVCFAQKVLLGEPKDIFVRINNCFGDKENLRRRIKTLQANFSTQTKIFCVRPEIFDSSFKHRSEFTEILEEHWGVDTFRDFTIYDTKKLDVGIKTTRQISQEQIIANIVDQVERCENAAAHKDIFVTAPTGAGKSLLFQIPAIYLAEKYGLLTIVISPLIGLMNDQVKGLEIRNYPHVRTINSDIAPILKEDAVEAVAKGECNILYISPETLLSRSDIEQLIGNRTVGMFVIDEAHIVTTWGKQFRPDYWYLGDQIQKIRKEQIRRKGRSFVIATFTATAIYGGLEDMFSGTINSLNMVVDEQTTYLGYVKRGDIGIMINPYSTKGERAEFKIDKFDVLTEVIDAAFAEHKKTLIYFPEVWLINKAKDALLEAGKITAIYHGKLSSGAKRESYEKFRSGEIPVMLATKAFGMGIDIDDIEVVLHFAPTGSVCDYVQEIGRAARRPNLDGTALYYYSKNDFKYINRLHGLSTIKNHQLVSVVEKIYGIYQKKRRHKLLLDAQNFAYIFSSYDEGDNINKVKTALLMIQRNFEFELGFSPITARPAPLFASGLFEIDGTAELFLKRMYENCLESIDADENIFRVNLKKIWEKSFSRNISFPQFKYKLYKNDRTLAFPFEVKPVLKVSVEEHPQREAHKKFWQTFREIIQGLIKNNGYYSRDDISNIMQNKCGIQPYLAQEMCDVLLASMKFYNGKVRKPEQSAIFATRGENSYLFKPDATAYFKWVDAWYHKIWEDLEDGTFYIKNTAENKANVRAYTIVLGIFEALGEITFDMIGGGSSQLYIQINQIRNLNYILNHRDTYRNKILEGVGNQHLLSVAMLTHIYESQFSNETIWDLLEDYFLGKIPAEVKAACLRKNPHMKFPQ